MMKAAYFKNTLKMKGDLYLGREKSKELLRLGFPRRKMTKILLNGKFCKRIKVAYALDYLFHNGLFVSTKYVERDKFTYNCYTIPELQEIDSSQKKSPTAKASFRISLVDAICDGFNYIASAQEETKLPTYKIFDGNVSLETAYLLKKIGYPQNDDKMPIPTRLQATQYLIKEKRIYASVSFSIKNDGELVYCLKITPMMINRIYIHRCEGEYFPDDFKLYLESALYSACCILLEERRFKLSYFCDRLQSGRFEFHYAEM